MIDENKSRADYRAFAQVWCLGHKVVVLQDREKLIPAELFLKQNKLTISREALRTDQSERKSALKKKYSKLRERLSSEL